MSPRAKRRAAREPARKGSDGDKPAAAGKEEPAAPPAGSDAAGPWALDLRALAAFRIGIGVLLVTDLVDRWLDFEAHYGAAGAVPRGGYLEALDGWHLSLHLGLGDVGAQLLFALAIALALLLIAGWRTRLVTLLSWLLLCSLHSRNYMVLQSGDTALRMGLFWGLFLPLGARWSLDAQRSAAPPSPGEQGQRIQTVATVALVAQLAAIYLVAAGAKLDQPLWWRDGLGAHFALHVDQFTTPLGVWVREQVGLVRVLNYATLVLELVAPALLLLPWRTSWARMAAFALVVPMHVGFALTMEIGLFSWIMIAWWLAMLPAGVWDRVEPVVRRGWAKLPRVERPGWMTRLWPPTPTLPPLRGEREPEPLAHSSKPELLAQSSKAHAPAHDARGEREPERLALTHTPARDPLVIGTRRWEKALVGVAAICCAWWLAAANSPAFAMPDLVQAPVRLLRLDQRWDMFSRPPRTGGWYLAPAALADGSQVDLRTGGAVDWSPPELPSAAVGSSRWIKYMTNLESARRYQRWYLAWLCRRWNDAHGPEQRATRAELVKMEQKTVAPGGRRPPAARVTLSTVECD